MIVPGRDWREALHPDPLCDECAEPATVMLWHHEAQPWRHLCEECLQRYQKKNAKRKFETRPVRR